jgi:threonine dehydrogenase-like Zn-dependent dehydrogenase
MRVADLITHRFQPEEAPQVYDMLQSDRGATLGVLFDWR